MAFQNPIGWRGIRCGGEVLIFVSEDIPSKELKSLTTAAKQSGLATEAATAGVLYKKVFLKISQNSQENTCSRASFLIKLQP